MWVNFAAAAAAAATLSSDIKKIKEKLIFWVDNRFLTAVKPAEYTHS